jgi:hypothetical protein
MFLELANPKFPIVSLWKGRQHSSYKRNRSGHAIHEVKKNDTPRLEAVTHPRKPCQAQTHSWRGNAHLSSPARNTRSKNASDYEAKVVILWGEQNHAGAHGSPVRRGREHDRTARWKKRREMRCGRVSRLERDADNLGRDADRLGR